MSSFVNLGFKNFVAVDKIVSVMNPDTAGALRLSGEARDNNKFTRFTCGRKTKSLILTTDKFVFASALTPETVIGRIEAS